MKLEVNVDKKYFFAFVLIGLIFIGIVGVIALADPNVFGHKADEINWDQPITKNITAAGFCIGTNCVTSWTTSSNLPTCTEGKVLKYTGGAWVCGDDLSGSGGGVAPVLDCQAYPLAGLTVTNTCTTGAALSVGKTVEIAHLASQSGSLLGEPHPGNYGMGCMGPGGGYSLYGCAVCCKPLSGGGGGSGVSSQWTNTTGGILYYNGGNVGIGISNPSVKLEVVGNTKMTGNLSVNGTFSFVVGGKRFEVQPVTGSEDTYPAWLPAYQASGCELGDSCNGDVYNPYTTLCGPTDEFECRDEAYLGGAGSGYCKVRTINCKLAWAFVKTS